MLTGTFDPVHLGHIAMAQSAMAACNLAEVWLLVNPDPGHKRGVASLMDRLAMVRLAVDGAPGLREGEPGDHGVRHHTMQEFEALMSRHTGYDFVFIVGDDVLAGIGAWPEAEKAEFAAVRRPGQAVATIAPDLKVTWFEMSEYAETSSGKVKRALAAGQAAEVPESVRNYIEKRALYKP